MKKIRITVFVILILFVVLLALTSRTGYDIYEDVSYTEITPLDGVTFEINSGRKSGHIQIENNTKHYIVTDFHRYPIHVEIQKDDGWHRILSTKMIYSPSNAISENETYSLDFSWKDFIGGSLKPGKYRAILFFGDGNSEDFYSTAAEFHVK